MADPLKLQILKAMTSSLETISVTGGYRHDLEGSVFRGRNRFDDNDPLPMVSLLEAPVPMDKLAVPPGSQNDSGGWELLIQGFSVDDDENPTDPAHLLMADVKRALVLEMNKSSGAYKTTGPFGLGKFIRTMYIGQGVVRPPEEYVSAKAYFWLGVRLGIVENLASS